MLKKALLLLAFLLVVLLAAIAMQPATFRVERSTEVATPAVAIFPLVDDFHHWPAWSPWEKLDPTMQRTYEGPSSGVGAKYSWSGNDEVGTGNMTILESVPDQRVRYRLEFIEPWSAVNTTEFVLAPTPNGTRVTWSMAGENNFMTKAVSLFADMDKMIGKDFEEGLANLKQLAESQAKGAA